MNSKNALWLLIGIVLFVMMFMEEGSTISEVAVSDPDRVRHVAQRYQGDDQQVASATFEAGVPMDSVGQSRWSEAEIGEDEPAPVAEASVFDTYNPTPMRPTPMRIAGLPIPRHSALRPEDVIGKPFDPRLY